MADFSGNHRESFDNGYGFSMCIGMYGDGEINCAVFNTETGELDYSTPITSDTMRCETVGEAARIRNLVAQLPKRGTCRWYTVKYTLNGKPKFSSHWVTSSDVACWRTKDNSLHDDNVEPTGNLGGYDTEHAAMSDNA